MPPLITTPQEISRKFPVHPFIKTPSPCFFGTQEKLLPGQSINLDSEHP